jgi:hypothetical protein
MRNNWITRFTDIDASIDAASRKFRRAEMETVAIEYSDVLYSALKLLPAAEQDKVLAKFEEAAAAIQKMVR